MNGTHFYTFWFATITVLFPITLMLIGLVLFHGMMAAGNNTTLDIMKGHVMEFACFPTPFRGQVHLFDLGIIANLRNYFTADLFFFWLPFETVPVDDGIQY